MSAAYPTGGPDARQECPCSNNPDGFDPQCDVHGDVPDIDDVAYGKGTWR